MSLGRAAVALPRSSWLACMFIRVFDRRAWCCRAAVLPVQRTNVCSKIMLMPSTHFCLGGLACSTRAFTPPATVSRCMNAAWPLLQGEDGSCLPSAKATLGAPSSSSQCSSQTCRWAPAPAAAPAGGQPDAGMLFRVHVWKATSPSLVVVQVGLFSFMPGTYRCGDKQNNLAAATSVKSIRPWLDSMAKKHGK